MRRVATLLVCGLLLLAGAFDASGQSIQGGIRGAVRDANGVIPGAEVTLTNEATNVARTTVSNDVGEYNFSSVTPGTYSIKATLTGFKTFERQGVRIGTTQFITLDLLLEVGQVSEEITVTGDAPLIETSNASTGEVLDKAALDALPAPGRNAFMISVSVPTVVATGDPQFNRQQDQTNSSLLSLGGGTRRGNNYLVDGVAITDMRNRAMLIPSIEGVEEVKVQVHTYDAEMGRTGGGVFNTTLKSGSNAFHGAGFYQTRPVWGLANNYFNDKAGIAKDENQYYRLWGGGAGGAIVQNKWFYWGALEGYRSYTTRNGQLRFPTSRERNGDFSQTFNADGSLAVIYDPLHVVNGVRQPFPGNVIPADRLSTVGTNIANLMPTPDQDTSVAGQANYFRGASIIDRGDMFMGKMEYKVSDKLSLTGAYIDNTTQEPDTDYWKDHNPQGDPNRGKLFRDPKVLALNAVYIPNNTTAVTLHGGWSSFPDSCLPFDGRNPYDLASLGFPASYVNAVQFQKFPRGHVEGYGEFNNVDCTFGDRGRLDLVWRGWNINGSVSKFVGRHTFKYGADFRRQTIDVLCFGQSSGEFYFDRQYTVQDPNNVTASQGNALASMLLGYISSSGTNDSVVPISTKLRGFVDYYGGYVQDDFRVNSRFTLNYGLRYEFEQGFREKDNNISVAFDRDAITTLSNGVQMRGGLRYAGRDGFPDHQGDPSNKKFSPRVGVAYSLDDKTVVRGGYGIFWSPWNYQFPGSQTYGQFGFSTVTTAVTGTPSVPNLSAGGTGLLDDPFPQGILQPVGAANGLLTGVGGGFDYINQNRQSPYVHQWSIDVQRELPGNMAVSGTYLGSKGVDLNYGGSNDSLVPINTIPIEVVQQTVNAGLGLDDPVPNPFFGTEAAQGLLAGPTVPRSQLLRPFPAFGNVRERQTTGARSNYYAFILKLDRRLNNGWGGRFSYVYSQLKDSQFGESNQYSTNHQNANFGSRPLNPYDLDREYSIGILDRPHSIVLAPYVELPFGEGKKYATSGIANTLAGGWQISAIATFESGYPRNIVMNTDNTGTLGGVQRPNQTGTDPSLGLSVPGDFDATCQCFRNINPGAYAAPAAFTYGTAPRNDDRIRSPYKPNWDVVFTKNTGIGGPYKFQLRFEMLNLFNQVKLNGGGDGRVGNSNFGLLSSQAGFMRITQISFRVLW
jgi:hypothetical protein